MLLWHLLPLIFSVPPFAVDVVDNYIKSEMAKQHIPGLSLCVIQDDRVVKTQAYGLADVELNVPATEKSEFAIASMTKPVTASAILLLVQDGKLSLDDPITKYLSGLPETWKEITIRHLLTHTSGIKDHYGDFPMFSRVALDRRLEYSDSEYVKAHTDAPLNFRPGQYWAYSGSNFVFLGMIITKITGKPYPEFVRERIFAPLGMNDTHFIELAKIIPNRVSGYRGDSVLLNGYYTGQTFSSGADVSIITSAGDLCKWEVGLTAGKIWKSATVEQMWTPARLPNGAELSTLGAGSSGLGWAIGLFNGYKLIYHTGSFNIGFSSFIARIPEKRAGVVVLTNQWNAQSMALGLGVLSIYDSELTPPQRRTAGARLEMDYTAQIKQLVSAMFGIRGDVSSFVTSGYLRRMASIPENKQSAPPVTDVVLLGAVDFTKRNLKRFGVRVTRMLMYRIKLGGDDAYLTLYLDESGKIADVFAY